MPNGALPNKFQRFVCFVLLEDADSTSRKGNTHLIILGVYKSDLGLKLEPFVGVSTSADCKLIGLIDTDTIGFWDEFYLFSRRLV
jgi:hypothetical protein